MSPLLLLELLPVLLGLLGGGSLTAANLATIGKVLESLLTPDNISAALAFVKEHGPQVKFFIHEGVLWIESHAKPGPPIGPGRWDPAPMPRLALGPLSLGPLQPLKERGPG